MADVAVAEFDNEEVRDFLESMQTRLKKVQGADKKYVGLLSAIVYSDVINHFQTQKGSEGPWKTWSKSYKDYMQKIGKGGNLILQDSGRLRNTFLPTSNRKTSAGILWFNNAKTAGGFPYAAAHDEGGPKLPKRDFMWLSDEAMEKVSVQTLQFMIDEGV